MEVQFREMNILLKEFHKTRYAFAEKLGRSMTGVTSSCDMWSWRQWRCSWQSQVTLLVRTGKPIVCTTRDSAVVKTNVTPNTAFFVGNNFCYNDSEEFLVQGSRPDAVTLWT